jgi:predicted acetyltransferase
MSTATPAPGPDQVASPGTPHSPYQVRAITEDEFDSFHQVNNHAFHTAPFSAQHRAGTVSRFEFDRSLSAFDPSTGAPIGNTAAFSFQLTVPGATLPAAGVSHVAVLPTYRRRGVLSSLMRRQLADVRDRGEPLAILWASEAMIYGRYGYGRASWHLSYTVRRGEGSVLGVRVPGPGGVPGPGVLRLRLAEPADARAELSKVYETVLPVRPGFFARTEPWWQKVLFDPEEEREGASPLRCLLAEDDSGPRGYALYSGRGGWHDATFLPDGSLTVRELVAADPAAGAALWADLLSRDLTVEFVAHQRPSDDPLLFQLADPRRVRSVVSDGLWARITDAPKALAGRRYSAPVDLVIEVSDRDLPDNAGRWRLTTADSGGGAAGGSVGAGGDGFAASCSRTADAADLTLDIAELGAAYLGGTRLGTLAAAGLVTESRPGAVRQLSAAMSWDPLPWSPLIF